MHIPSFKKNEKKNNALWDSRDSENSEDNDSSGMFLKGVRVDISKIVNPDPQEPINYKLNESNGKPLPIIYH